MITKKISNSLADKANLTREIIEYRNRNNIEYYSSGDENQDLQDDDDDDDDDDEESEDENKDKDKATDT